jgi:hypothetical protein
VPIGTDSVQVIYETPGGTLKDRLLGRADEDNVSIATAGSATSAVKRVGDGLSDAALPR